MEGKSSDQVANNAEGLWIQASPVYYTGELVYGGRLCIYTDDQSSGKKRCPKMEVQRILCQEKSRAGYRILPWTFSTTKPVCFHFRTLLCSHHDHYARSL